MEGEIASMQYLAANWREHTEEWDPNDIRYSRSADIYIQRQDSMVLSVVKDCYEFSHGAHGAGWYESTNLNTQTGEEIPIDSVITDFTCLSAILEEELQEQYPHLEDVSMAEKIEKYIITDDSGYDYSLAWTLEYDGVRFYFGHYEVGVGYGGGRQSVNLLYSEYPELFNSMYFEGVQDDFVVPFSNSHCYGADLNEDGITEYITVSQDYESKSSAGYYTHYIVQLDDVVWNQEENYNYLRTFLVRNGEQHYLYIARGLRGEQNLLSPLTVFAVTANTIDYVGEFEGELQYFSNSSSFQICRPIDFLGSYNVIMECCVDDTGMPVAIQDRHIIADEVVLTSTAEIEAELIDEDGNLLGTSYVFPAGTRFTLKVTNAESHVEAETSDGRRCILYVNQGTTTMVNGYDATTVFDLE